MPCNPFPAKYEELWNQEEYEWFRDAYGQLAHYSSGRLIIEPFEVVEAVEHHRRCWRPDQTRVLLLGESHVFTQPVEAHRIKWLGNYAHILCNDVFISSLPDQFVRFVYCLAYGENDALLDYSKAGKNFGTPQYWKLFYSCCNAVAGPEYFVPILKTKTPTYDRLTNKLLLLQELKRRGVWLMDASIIGLYNPLAKKPPPATFDFVLRCCWKYYAGRMILKSAPRHIVVIGKGVYNTLRSQIDFLAAAVGCQVTIISQPQAHLSSVEQYEQYALLNTICSSDAS